MSSLPSSIFESLHQAQQSAKYALDLEGRVPFPVRAIVSENVDPEGRRRIKCIDPVAPAVETAWLRRAIAFPGFDPPLPKIGSTVFLLSIEGSTTDQVYLSAVNDTNPPLDKASEQDDLWLAVPGHQNERAEQSREISVGKGLKLKTDSGASIELTESGDVIIASASGATLSLESGIKFNTPTLVVGGKDIATVGALDSRGDRLTTKGWS